MELLEERIILNLKSRFFDIISAEEGLFQYESIIKQMLITIKELMKAETVTLYQYNECKQQLIMESSTNIEGNISSFTMAIPVEEMERMILDKKILRKPFRTVEFNYYDLAIPIKQDDKIQSYLLIKDECGFFSQFSDLVLEKLSLECGSFIQRAREIINLLLEEKRYKQLFRVTEKVHSTMDMETVLGEIITILKELYPTFTYFLFLSQDHKEYEGLPIKELEYDDENIAIMQTYVTGTTQFEDSVAEKKSILYAPLKGKQGIYGVLQVIAPNTLIFPTNEVEFISLLANTAGGAMENAQLYEQSRRLIADLQLINETSHRLNSNLRLTDTMEYMSNQIVKSLGAQEVGFIQFSTEDTLIQILPGTTSFFFEDDARFYIDYIREKILEENDCLFMGDLKLPSIQDKNNQYKSVMAVPMMQSDVLNGFVLVLHQRSYAFTFETFKLFRSLIHHSTLAFTNTILREELEKMVITDHLTKLYSRSYLDEKIQESMKVDGEGTFIIIDIDNFKVINDTYGHQVGDEVIIQVANIIQSNIRGSDIGARWGGEELAIYLPMVSIETGVQIAERLVKKVRESSSPSVTISCGISFWQKDDNDCYKSLFKRADNALYTAKETGKNKVVIQQ